MAKTTKSRKRKEEPSPLFAKRAERAFKTVAAQVRAETRRHGLKPLEWKD